MVHYQVQISVLLMMILFGVREVCSIQCYSCSSRGNPDCLKPLKYSVPLKNCSTAELENTRKYAEELDQSFNKIFHLDIHAHEPQVPLNCLKQITKVGAESVVIRGCQLAASENMSVCGKLLKNGKDNIQVMHCTLCNRDGCNSGFFHHPSIEMIALLSMILIVIANRASFS